MPVAGPECSCYCRGPVNPAAYPPLDDPEQWRVLKLEIAGRFMLDGATQQAADGAAHEMLARAWKAAKRSR